MPDWSYHTLFKPLLFGLQPKTARALTLRTAAWLGNLPGGLWVIDLLARMQPAKCLSHELMGLRFPGRVGLCAGLCFERGNIKAFQRFGFGFIEVGPVTLKAVPEEVLERRLAELTIVSDDAPSNPGLDVYLSKVLPNKRIELPLFVRIAHERCTTFDTSEQELSLILTRLPDIVDALVIDTRWALRDFTDEQLSRYLKLACNKKRTLLSIAPDTPENEISRLVHIGAIAGISGVSLAGGIESPLKETSHLRTYGRGTRELTLKAISIVRERNPSIAIIASDGVTEPADALEMMEAGADMVSLYSGLVYSGPGLPKRINELVTCYCVALDSELDTAPSLSNQTERKHSRLEIETVLAGARLPEPVTPYSAAAVLQSGWLGLALVGAGLIVTGSSAITVALTTVILPYDEKYLGLTRSAMIAINSNLLPFMSHDRVTYAGAGMSCGLLFFALAYFGARNGQSWAYEAARNSCAFGFASFLLFLGFRYLDPLHALATLLLLPFFIWALVKPPAPRALQSSNLYNTVDWHNGLSGQLCFVAIGIGLILAGITICRVGTTCVFVHEDLMFMHTTAGALLSQNNHLLPTIAHDRAGFGGSLVTAGIAVILTALHGYRQGEGWVWWMLLISGLPGFLSTLAIHFAIGYTNWFHLLPAYIASVMFAAGLSLSYRYLCAQPGPGSFSWRQGPELPPS